MPYIGKSPVASGFHKLDNLTASATDTYALTLGGAAYYPETANQLLVSLNGVIQAPQDSFTVSGSNIVFDSALTASDSIDFIVALGDVIGVGSVTDGAITTAKLGNAAVTDAKIDTMAASKLTGALPASVTSGGVYLGGTGAANKLSDYETGTFTATLRGSSTEPATLITTTGVYTKVGRIVAYNISYENITTTGYSGSAYIQGLPFQNDGERTINPIASYTILTFTENFVSYIPQSGTTVEMRDVKSNAGWNDVFHNAGTGYIWASGIYQTNS